MNYLIGDVAFRAERQPQPVRVVMHKYFNERVHKEVQSSNPNIKRNLELKRLANDRYRNKILVSYIVKAYFQKRHIIVLSWYVDHLKELMGLIHERLVKDGQTTNGVVGWYIGTTKKKDRATNSSCPIVLATYGMAKEGLDVPSLNTAVYALPEAKIEQSSGRIMRKTQAEKGGDEQQIPTIYYIFDDYSMYKSFGFNHMRTWRLLGYRIDHFETRLEDAVEEAEEEATGSPCSTAQT